MELSELRHRQNSMPFFEWIDDPASWPATDPASLIEICDALLRAFDGSQLAGRGWLEARELYLAALIRRGLRPMLPNYETGIWEWTNHFNEFLDEPDDRPEAIAAAVLTVWYGWGASGGAEHVRFGTRLSTAPVPERGEFA